MLSVYTVVVCTLNSLKGGYNVENDIMSEMGTLFVCGRRGRGCRTCSHLWVMYYCSVMLYISHHFAPQEGQMMFFYFFLKKIYFFFSFILYFVYFLYKNITFLKFVFLSIIKLKGPRHTPHSLLITFSYKINSEKSFISFFM